MKNLKDMTLGELFPELWKEGFKALGLVVLLSGITLTLFVAYLVLFVG